MVTKVAAGEPVSAKDVKESIAAAKATKNRSATEQRADVKQPSNDTGEDLTDTGQTEPRHAHRKAGRGRAGRTKEVERQESGNGIPEEGQAEVGAAGVSAELLRRNLPDDVFAALKACASSDDSWNALRTALKDANA